MSLVQLRSDLEKALELYYTNKTKETHDAAMQVQRAYLKASYESADAWRFVYAAHSRAAQKAESK